jgi:hypothetical protein
LQVTALFSTLMFSPSGKRGHQHFAAKLTDCADRPSAKICPRQILLIS